MERNVKDKIVVVTGGAQGIGLSIADNFLVNGAKLVIILDIDDAGHAAAIKLNEEHGEGRAVFIKCDIIKDLDKVSSKIISAYKTVDILVNNAGWAREDSIRDTLQLNVVALVEWSLKFLEHMGRDKGGNGGTILNMSSKWGYESVPFVPFYVTSKYAVLGFTKSLGHIQNYEKTGVRMIAMCPGFTRTRLVAEPEQHTSDEAFSQYVNTLPKQDPDAVGKAAVEIFKTAESGTAWLIEGGKPIVHLP